MGAGTKGFSGPMEFCPGFSTMARAYQNAALFMGAGTSSNRVKTALASKKFIEFRFETTATSGDNRAVYLQYYISGAGAGGECLRAYTRVNNVAAGSAAHGAHLSLGFVTSGRVTGLAAAVRTTLHVPTTGPSTGSYYGTYAEMWMDGNASSLASVAHAILYVGVNGANATARKTCKNAVAFKGEDGTGEMIYDHTHAEGNAGGSVRITINGVARYLKYWDAE